MERLEEGAAGRAIVIMGVSGSGKSTLAGLLSQLLDCPFLEGDAFHCPANVAKMRSGQPLTDADRWPWLDHLGASIGQSVQHRGIAVAACSALRRCYRDRLRAAIVAPTAFVLLEASREELVCRVSNRPNHYMPASLIDSQLATLEPPDPAECAITIGAGSAPERGAERVLQWLALQPAAGNGKLR